MRALWAILSVLLTPFLFVFLRWRGLRDPRWLENSGERFGRYGTSGTKTGSVWIHGASVGEIQAAAPLIQALLARQPQVGILITSFTPTGQQRARDLFGDQVEYRLAPWDIGFAVRGFLSQHRPRMAVFMETELWPNTFLACQRAEVPLVLASARVSARSADRYRRVGGLIRDTLSVPKILAVQSQADADRFIGLGAPAERVCVNGNIKFDFTLPPDITVLGGKLRDEHGTRDRPTWVAASTHDGEDHPVLDAHRRVLETQANALLILVPRHPERFDAVAAMISAAGFKLVRRSSGQRCTPETQVLLGDSMGELMLFYAAADLAFVGGSLVPVGGHNLLEPAALALPSITGRYNANSSGVAEILVAAGATREVGDGRDLAAAVRGWLAAPQDRERAGARGLWVLQENRGAAQRLVDMLDPLLTD